MICEQLKNGICSVATNLARKDVLPILSQCEYCTQQVEPSQSINRVTVSLAINGAVDAETKLHVMETYGHLLTRSTIKASGPGTELQKLISWFYSPDNKRCKCATRIAKMNAWGPDKCEENMDTILRWLKHSATINSVIYVESAVRLLVQLAIRRARKNV
jgi:hypothetical protein